MLPNSEAPEPPDFELPGRCHFYELKSLLRAYSLAVINPLLTKLDISEHKREIQCLKIARHVFAIWFYPQCKGECKRAIEEFDVHYENFENFKIRSAVDKYR